MNNTSLSGKRVLVTRAQEQADSFATLLANEGAVTTELAVLTITAPADCADLDRALTQLSSYDYIVFASRNAVEFTFARLEKLNLKPDSTGSSVEKNMPPKIASIGPGTSEALKERGVEITFEPSDHIAESMVSEFPGYPDLHGVRVFWPRTNIGRSVISDGLRKAGAHVDTAIAYQSGFPPDSAALAQKLVTLLRRREIDVITLASAQTARNLATLIKDGLKTCAADESLEDLLENITIAAIGPITGQAAREELGRIDVIAEKHTLPGLTEALLASLKFEQNCI